MKKLVSRITFTTISVLTVAVVLSGCSVSEPAEGGYEANAVVTVNYKGNNLDCITWNGSHFEKGLTCDFVAYHENPESSDEQEGVQVVTVDFQGRPLDCITWDGSHFEKGLTCDFVAYHENTATEK